VIVNNLFLRNIRNSNWLLVLQTLSGVCRINQVGDLPGVGTVWYYPQGSANILSRYRMVTQSKWRVSYNSARYHETGNEGDLSEHVVTPEGSEFDLAPNRRGLHVLDCTKYFEVGRNGCVFGNLIPDDGMKNINANTYLSGEAIDTIQGSKKNYSIRDQRRAERARRFQHFAGHPSDHTLIYSAMTNGIIDSPVSKRDVELAFEIFGRSQYALRGKVTASRPAVVEPIQILESPKSITNYYKNIELCIDVMHVNRVPFLLSISKHIHYGQVVMFSNLKAPTLEAGIVTLTAPSIHWSAFVFDIVFEGEGVNGRRLRVTVWLLLDEFVALKDWKECLSAD